MLHRRRKTQLADGACVSNEVVVLFSSKATIDVEYNGRTARFYGELGLDSFQASAASMKWMTTQKDVVPTETERNEVILAVKQLQCKKRNRVFFVDKNGKEI
jgi:hypothetical protein